MARLPTVGTDNDVLYLRTVSKDEMERRYLGAYRSANLSDLPRDVATPPDSMLSDTDSDFSDLSTESAWSEGVRPLLASTRASSKRLQGSGPAACVSTG